MLHAILSFTN